MSEEGTLVRPSGDCGTGEFGLVGRELGDPDKDPALKGEKEMDGLLLEPPPGRDDGTRLVVGMELGGWTPV